MKIDITTKPTRSARRVLSAFTTALFKLLLDKSFAQITVNEICDSSNYPRATFYNYFDDKYDLLNYFWQNIAQEIHVDDYAQIAPEELLSVFYDRIYDLCEKYGKEIKYIFKNNTSDSYFFVSFKVYMKSQIKNIFNYIPKRSDNPLPKELMAEHYCNTILMVLEWHFGEDHPVEKAETKNFMQYLLKEL